MLIECLAFDCFGTVFDMADVSRDEIREYVSHVRKNDFTPFAFPVAWWNLKAHADAAEGIAALQAMGIKCVALSNGSVELIRHVSANAGIKFDHVVDLVAHRVYKPRTAAYRTIEKDLGITTSRTCMVTANPGFGDIEGAKAVGMLSQIIRQPNQPQTIGELAASLGTI